LFRFWLVPRWLPVILFLLRTWLPHALHNLITALRFLRIRIGLDHGGIVTCRCHLLPLTCRFLPHLLYLTFVFYAFVLPLDYCARFLLPPVHSTTCILNLCRAVLNILPFAFFQLGRYGLAPSFAFSPRLPLQLPFSPILLRGLGSLPLGRYAGPTCCIATPPPRADYGFCGYTATLTVWFLC